MAEPVEMTDDPTVKVSVERDDLGQFAENQPNVVDSEGVEYFDTLRKLDNDTVHLPLRISTDDGDPSSFDHPPAGISRPMQFVSAMTTDVDYSHVQCIIDGLPSSNSRTA